VKLHRLAQVLAWLSLGCLAAFVWLGGALFSTLHGPMMWMSAAMLAGDLLDFLDKTGYTVAVVAAVLLLVSVARRRQRAGFIALLGVTILLALTYATDWHDVLFSQRLFPPGTAPTPAIHAAYMALYCAPSALLALVVVAWSVVGGLAAQSTPAGTSADSPLDIHMESLHADVVE
jgi:hypothetical protein